MLTSRQQKIKRIFDLSISIMMAPFAIFPLFLLLIIARISTGKSGLFIQPRIGYQGTKFLLYKIRTLKGDNHDSVFAIRAHETKFGSWLRKSKLDELPQIFNIIKGEMSWVGPRPDVLGYADELVGEDRVILTVKPGITGPATLKYKSEEVVLLTQQDPNKYNDEVIWPDKVTINKEYIKEWSLQTDMYYLFASVFRK